MNVNTNLKAGLLQGEPVRSSCRKWGGILLLLVIAALPSRAQNLPNDPLYPPRPDSQGQWGLKQIGAEEAWKISTGSRDNSNVIVVIDSGIDYNHEDLMANLWTSTTNIVTPNGLTCPPGTHGFDLTTLDTGNRCLPWDWDVVGPQKSHGTGVAGIIGAVGNNGKGVVGVNWAARIMAIRAKVDPQATADAIKFAVNLKQLFTTTHGAEGANVRVINISRGGSENSWKWSPTGPPGTQGEPLLAIQEAAKENILVVASAGNNGKDNDGTPIYPASFTTTEPNVISVAATDNADSLASSWLDDNGLPEKSNFGANSVDLAAPGIEVVTTYRHDLANPFQQGYARHASGTSYAAPFVSGAAALILSACDVDAATLKKLIMENVDPLPPTEFGKTVSNGRLNV